MSAHPFDNSNESSFYHQAMEALDRGDLKQASDLCQSILQAPSLSAQGLHVMSRLFYATGNFSKSCDYAALATQLDGQVTQYQLQQGHGLFALQEYKKAQASFEHVTVKQPDNALAQLWMGHCLKALEHFDAAYAAYDKARSLSDDEAIWFAAAECYLEQGRMEEAQMAIEAGIVHLPASAQGHYVAGLHALCDDNHYKADQSFIRATELNPHHAQAHFYLALLRNAQHKYQESARLAMHVLKHHPTHIPSLMLLAFLCEAQGDKETSLKACSHILALAPQHLLAWQQLMTLYEQQQRLPETMPLLRQAAESSMCAVALEHLRALYRGDVPAHAPCEYVRRFYDLFAESFGYWLLASGDDSAAQQLTKVLASMPDIQNSRHLSLLDVGCNIGRTAYYMKDFTAIRVGVDVSTAMMKYARRSGMYDVVYELDALEFMIGCDMKFDVVTAVGALRWTGNLQPIFHAVRNVMHKKTLFAFMLAREPSTLAYTVQLDGRYQHHANYVRDIAQAEGLSIECSRDCEWFDNQGALVQRHLFILKKMVLH